MAKRHTFVINDESVLNDNGFRVMNAGIKLVGYKKNPLVLWMHKRPRSWDENDKTTDRFPIGLAYNIRKNPENASQLLADVEFDSNDEFAKQIASKVEGGFLRMTSLGLRPSAWSEHPNDLLPGQGRRTLKKSELREISIVDLASNPNTVKLYDADSNVIKLSSDSDNSDIIPLLSEGATDADINLNTNTEMNTILVTLSTAFGLGEDAKEADVIRHALNLSSKYEAVEKERDALRVELSAQKTEVQLAGKTSAFDIALKAKKVVEGQRDALMKLSLPEMETVLDGMVAPVNLAGGDPVVTDDPWKGVN